VFAIQQSKNHVPRWFTEGLSEYETIVRRPEWQREEDPALYAAFKAGRVPKVASFNRAFTHVDSVDEVVMAYYAASQLLVFMTQEFGFQKVVSMLPRWADGKRTPQVVQEALGIGTDELDKRFRGFLDRSLARYKTQFVPDLHSPPLDEARKAVKAAPNDARKLLELALALFQEDQGPEGEAVLAEALKKDPNQPDVNFLLLRKAFRSKDLAGAQKLADKLIANGGDGYAVRMKAADLAEVAMAKADQEKKPDDAKKHLARMKEHLGKAAEFDPSMAEPVAALYDLAKKADDEEGQLAALRRLSALDQNDRRVWIRLLRLLVKRGLWEEARVVGEGALFVDVSSPEVHRLYARALARTGRFVSAVFELNSAILCKPPTEELVEIYGELAKAYAKLGEGDFEKQALEWKRSLENVPKAKKKTDDDELRRDDEN
jgi:Flp pilus assembly protein TadD